MVVRLVLIISTGFLLSATPGQALTVKEALGQFETGATLPIQCRADRRIGNAKEISRYQILPQVWTQYSNSKNYHNPDVAWSVASRILLDRYRQFNKATGRHWDYMDLYIMWNAPGEYARARFNRKRIPCVVLNRAQRFANLLEESGKPPQHLVSRTPLQAQIAALP